MAQKYEELSPQVDDSRAQSNSIAPRLPRILHSGPMARLRKSDGFHGVVCQLVYVEDFRLAPLVSWHLESSLPYLVTANRECIADREIRQWCRQQRMGGVIDLAGVNRCTLTEHSQLPHEQIRQLREPPAGNPRYLLNCVRFNTDVPQERLQYRALFHSLTGGVLVMDSMADAAAYRALLVQHHIRAPGILVLKELKFLSANNLERFDDRATAPGLDRLSTHIEVRAPSDGRRARAQRQVEALRAVMPVLRTLEQTQSSIDAARASLRFDERTKAEGELASKLQAEVQRLKADIQRLQGATSGTALAAAAATGGEVGRLAQQHEQHQRESRRQHMARLLALQQEAAATAATATGSTAGSRASRASAAAAAAPTRLSSTRRR
jgi:hypothetical protein